MLCSACSTRPEHRVAITEVTVIDAQAGVRRNQTVIVEGDRIISVAPSNGIPDSSHRIDGKGKFLIPGLWDMHVHLTYDARFTASMPELFLKYGITSVRDTGGMLEKLTPVIEKMRTPGAVAPRVFFSGPLMDGRDVVYDGESAPKIGIKNASPEEGIANVQAMQQAGADFIKIYEMVSPEVFAAIANEADRLNLPIAAHVPLSMLASEAAPSVQSLEHLRNLELDCADNATSLLEERRAALRNLKQKPGIKLRSQLHKAQRLPAVTALDKSRCESLARALQAVIQVPTARLNTLTLRPVWETPAWKQAALELPETVRQEWQSPPTWMGNANPDSRFATHVLKTIKQLHDAGVPIGAGTDTPIGRAIPGYSLHVELQRLVEAGLSPLDALESATLVPARFFGWERQMGAIAEGMKSDLLLLNANPLIDIANTLEIEAVIYRGQVLDSNSVNSAAN